MHLSQNVMKMYRNLLNIYIYIYIYKVCVLNLLTWNNIFTQKVLLNLKDTN